MAVLFQNTIPGKLLTIKIYVPVVLDKFILSLLRFQMVHGPVLARWLGTTALKLRRASKILNDASNKMISTDNLIIMTQVSECHPVLN